MSVIHSIHSIRLRGYAAAGATALALLVLGSGQALAGSAASPTGLTYSAVDLGTLSGGSTSTAIAMDHKTVVGNSDTGSGFVDHGYAYDRSTHVMTDLGSLGGTDTTAIDVDGRYVVGDSSTATGERRGFAYDLRTHHMTGIGTFGGSGSQVSGISGRIVVGSARTTGDASTHAFAYDARTHAMTDLGSLAGPSGVSTATGVANGRYITGSSDIPGVPYPATHAYVYDLRTHVMTDLGANGGYSSTGSGISGHWVVGIAQPSAGSPSHGFVYNLRTGVWTDLGVQMAYHPRISGHTVVDTDGHAAYAYDLTTGTRVPFGPGVGTTDLNGFTGKFVAGDTFPGPNAVAYRVDTGQFVQLPGFGGPYSTAAAADRRGYIVGTAASGPGTSPTVSRATLWVPSTS